MEIWTTLTANGTKGPFFVQSKDKKFATLDAFEPSDYAHVSYLPRVINPTTKKDTRPGERGFLQYLDYMINSAKYFRFGDLILCDGERAFHTAKVHDYLASYNIQLILIEPPIYHQFINPCDNHFHSLFKTSYYRLISHENYREISLIEKLRLAQQCFEAIGEEDIRNMFIRCGLLESDLSSRDVLSALVFEGFGCENKSLDRHRRQLEAYLQWCEDCGFPFLSSSLTEDMLRYAGLI